MAVKASRSTPRGKTRKWSSSEIKKAWEKLQAEIGRERSDRERRGEIVTSITLKELEEKLKHAKSPIIVGQVWSGNAAPGGTIDYSVRVLNPDPVEWIRLAVSVTIGNRNPIADNDQFLTTFDARFATYAKPAPIGFTLAPGASATQAFVIRIPAGLEQTGYFGNANLLQISFHDTGTYFDRACFFFDVI